MMHRTDGKFVKPERNGPQAEQQLPQPGRRRKRCGRLCTGRPDGGTPDVPERYAECNGKLFRRCKLVGRLLLLLLLLLPAIVTKGNKSPLGKLFQLGGFPATQSKLCYARLHPGGRDIDGPVGNPKQKAFVPHVPQDLVLLRPAKDGKVLVMTHLPDARHQHLG
uniref:Uncharacterized protein n=1 Tax=Anopheles melas TaxID=34690 RepID=A0A182UDM4_9DIPT